MPTPIGSSRTELPFLRTSVHNLGAEDGNAPRVSSMALSTSGRISGSPSPGASVATRWGDGAKTQPMHMDASSAHMKSSFDDARSVNIGLQRLGGRTLDRSDAVGQEDLQSGGPAEADDPDHIHYNTIQYENASLNGGVETNDAQVDLAEHGKSAETKGHYAYLHDDQDRDAAASRPRADAMRGPMRNDRVTVPYRLPQS